MSLQAMCWAQKQKPSGGLAAKAVLSELANVHNDLDARLEIILKISTLADRCMLSERQVQRLLKSLEKNGLIEREARYSKRSGWQVSNRYILCLAVMFICPKRGKVGGDKLSGEGDMGVTAEGVTPASPHPKPKKDIKSNLSAGSETRTAEAAGSLDAGEVKERGALGTQNPKKGASRDAVSSAVNLDEVIKRGAFAGLTYRQANARNARPRGREYA